MRHRVAGIAASVWIAGSAFVAAVFALHPLHVESVAWVSERRDVLSGLFFALTLFLYPRWLGASSRRLAWGAVVAALWALHPMKVESVAWASERKDVLFAAFYLGAMSSYLGWLDSRRRRWLALSVLLAVGGLLSKSMALTLPLALLAIDLVRARRWRLAGLIDKLPRILCAQSARANPLYLSYQTRFRDYRPVVAQKTVASAIQIGNPVSYERAVKVLVELDGVVEQASEQELADACARADRTGLYTCPHTGVALAALFKALARGEIRPTDRVVVISTAHGLKFTNFKVAYHDSSLQDVVSRYANPPVELPADVGAVRTAIDERLMTDD